MDTQLREYKKTLRDYMRRYYTEANLVDLLDHARSGGLAYNSCCCFIGLPSRDHDGFAGHNERLGSGYHGALYAKSEIPTAAFAEFAFLKLSHRNWTIDEDDSYRQRLLIPMILAELKRRRQLQEVQPVPTSCWDCSERIEDGVHDCPLKEVV